MGKHNFKYYQLMSQPLRMAVKTHLSSTDPIIDNCPIQIHLKIGKIGESAVMERTLTKKLLQILPFGYPTTKNGCEDSSPFYRSNEKTQRQL